MSLKAQILRSKFLRRGGVGLFTFPFEQAGTALRVAVLERARLGATEEPVLLSTSSPQNWVLFTTTRVLSSTTREMRSIDYADIDAASLIPRGFPARKKDELDTIELTLAGGARVLLKVEPGAPFFGLVNALRAAVAVSARRGVAMERNRDP
jgi:hypothetical protein